MVQSLGRRYFRGLPQPVTAQTPGPLAARIFSRRSSGTLSTSISADGTTCSGIEKVIPISTFCPPSSLGISRRDDTQRYMMGLISSGCSTTSMASSSSSASASSSPFLGFAGIGDRSSIVFVRLFFGRLCFFSRRLIVSACLNGVKGQTAVRCADDHLFIFEFLFAQIFPFPCSFFPAQRELCLVQRLLLTAGALI